MIIYFNTRKKNGTPLVSIDPGVGNVKSGVMYKINGVNLIGTYAPGGQTYRSPYSKLPNVESAMCDWFQPLTFETIVKSTKNFKTVETATTINFSGMIQPLTQEQLAVLPNVNYSWSYFMVHSCTKLQLKTDDRIKYKGQFFRVQSKRDYSDYGYMEYNIVQDYTGSDPVGTI